MIKELKTVPSKLPVELLFSQLFSQEASFNPYGRESELDSFEVIVCFDISWNTN